MEFLILLAAILLAGLGLVIWFRVSNDWHDRDQWRRFQDAMRADDDRRPE